MRNSNDPVPPRHRASPDRLDKALFRRFDDLIEFGLPQEPQVRQTIRTLLAGVKTDRLSWKRLLAAARGLSYSEISRACEEAIKDMLIGEKSEISTDMLLAALTVGQPAGECSTARG